MRSRRFTIPLLVAALALATFAGPAAGQAEPTLPTSCPDGAPSADFTDVSADNVHVDAIDCLVSHDIVQGTSVAPLTFSPGATATRGQIATVLAGTLDAADIELPEAEPTFDDVPATSTHAGNIGRIAAAGIVLGREDNTFAPGETVTRGQIATMAVNTFEYAQGLPAPADNGPYWDDTSTSVHADNIDAAHDLDLVLGRTESTFEPSGNARRDQLSSIVDRLLAVVEALPEPDFELTLLHINDGESMLLPTDEVPGAARFVAAMQSLQDDAVTDGDTGVLTISSGDNFLAGPRLNASLETEGVFYDALVYNNANFDAMTIGNHEFDFGPDVLADFISAIDGDIPFLSANLDISEEDVLVDLDRIVPSTTIEVAGRDVGIIGATTELLENISSPRDVVVNEVLGAVQGEIDALQADGVEHIILSSHLQDLDEELMLVPELSGIDAVIGGGGGEALRDEFPLFAVNADGDQVPVVTTPGNYTDIGRLVLGFDDNGDVIRTGPSSQLVPVALDGPQDATTLTEVEEPVEAFVEDLDENVLATTEVPLDGRRDSVRSRETNLGSLLADAMLFGARDLAAEYGAEEADVALQNGGGMRSDAIIDADDDVTELDTFDIAAFVNFTSIATIDGDTLAAVLEHSVSGLPDPQGFHGQWAGVEFTFDTDAAVGDRIVDATVTRADDTEVDLVVDGEVVAGGEEFTIASINFLFDGGDGYPFDLEGDYLQLPITYQDALANRFSELGTVTAADYPDLTVNEDRYDRFGPVGGDFLD